MPFDRRSFVVHVYPGDDSTVVEDALTRERVRVDDPAGAGKQITLWLNSPPPDESAHGPWPRLIRHRPAG